MIYFFIFGVRSSKLKEKKLSLNSNCPNCQQKSFFLVTGEANYFHLFWIPIIPLLKEVRIRCLHCDKEFAKKDFPEDVKRSLKNSKVRRPIWHFIVPILILYKLVTALLVFGYFFVEDMMYESEQEKVKEERAIKVEETKQVFANDKKSMQLIPSLATDSISYKLKQEFPFSDYNVNNEKVALFSKIEKTKLLLLIDVKEKGKLIEAEGCVLVSQIKNFLIEAYPEKYFDFYVALYENDDLKMLHTPFEVYETEYESPVPLNGFYADDEFYYRNEQTFKDKQKKLKLLSDFGKKDLKEVEVDVVKVEKSLKKVTDKYKFLYRGKRASLDKTIKYECKFTLETGNMLPDELRTMFNLYDGNGPFFSWNFLYSKTRKINEVYKRLKIEAPTKNNTFKDKRLLPLNVSPYWIPFYEDNVYSYALDMLPGEKGHVGQVILLEPREKPKFIAKNMSEFLKLYHDEKLPTALKDWVR